MFFIDCFRLVCCFSKMYWFLAIVIRQNLTYKVNENSHINRLVLKHLMLFEKNQIIVKIVNRRLYGRCYN